MGGGGVQVKDLYAGLDPGKSGAFGLVDLEGKFVAVYDNPETDDEVADLVAKYEERIVMVTIEKAQAFPKQGVASSFNYGIAYGVWRGAFALAMIPRQDVHANKWQAIKQPAPKPKDLNEKKKQSRERARQLWPEAPINKKKHDGRAEALLITEWGRRELLIQPAGVRRVRRK